MPSRGNEKSLHWFGLTDGCYWLEVGGVELLRYSQPLLDHWVREYPAARNDPHVNYPPIQFPDFEVSRILRETP